MILDDTTIVAIATSPGTGAIAIIRLSGKDAIAICDSLFKPSSKNKKLTAQKPYTIHHGTIYDGNRPVDEVLVSLFKAPRSYTSEDVVEISCHGSQIIQQQILELLVRNGARLAQPGEFTLRAFLNGKMDLSQAEAVADLISSSSEAARRVALQQMRGGFSDQLKNLRDQLLHFIALIELELDFSEEDVEFADRTQLKNLISEILSVIEKMIASFQLGNVIKMGIPVTIAGKPNVGKSTLLNRLLNEERAIVSEIAGTTRDTIEDTINLGGISFRFIDTAGLRHTKDTVESIGIERAYAKISQAKVILLIVDAQITVDEVIHSVEEVKTKLTDDQRLIILLNKEDKADKDRLNSILSMLKKDYPTIYALTISAKSGHNIEQLTNTLINIGLHGQTDSDEVIVTNVRHYESLLKTKENLDQAITGLTTNLPSDLLAIDIRQAIYYLGEITGEITTDDILGHIFSKFCIGK
ncbi:MAG: tRNA uridine-5-carboxymethylaminomethyl(34) synthesis GTPase MnmE [Bacteroidales bacterium]|nr:tRNA uridine-5-carboxymethylaminomethyl(34) synthesis GTPase MnmE [Bacteroidales bacterium]